MKAIGNGYLAGTSSYGAWGKQEMKATGAAEPKPSLRFGQFVRSALIWGRAEVALDLRDALVLGDLLQTQRGPNRSDLLHLK